MIKDLITAAKYRFISGAHTELRAQNNRTRRVTMVSGNLVANTRNDHSGVSARVYKNGVYGFASNAEYTDASVTAVIDAASENADFLAAHAGREAPLLAPISAPAFEREYPIPETDQKAYVDFVRGLDDYIARKYKNLAGRTVIATEDSQEKLLRVSDGRDAHTGISRSYIYVFLNAETDSGTPVELFDAFGGEHVFSANFTDPALIYPQVDALYERIMKKREGVYADAGEKTVILGGMMTGMLAHEAVGHTVEADLVIGGSVAAHSLGKRVGSELVNMVDFAHTAFGKPAPLPVFVDDEGTPATDARLIENGILVGYMNSRETALRFGMEPNGNARAWSFSDEPLIRMRNTAVLPGKDKLEDMIASVDDGYLLLNSSNGQADTTGEFMFGVSFGYEIKHGKLGRALLDTTVSGVAFDMLKTVDMVSDEVVWASSGFCGKKQPMSVGMGGPALRCKIMIGGR